MSNFYRGPSIDTSYQVSYHLAKRFQRKSCFRNRTIRNKNCLWRTCLLTDQNGMSNLYRGPSIDVSYQVSVYLDKLCQSRRFLEIDQSETRIACGGHELMDRVKMNNLYREPTIDASYQALVHLAKRFQRRRFFRNQPIRNKNCLWTDWDKMSNLYKRTFHRCFLPSFESFGHAVSE